MFKKLIILDRDGVINHDSDNYIKNESEWVLIPGADEAIRKLYEAGYYVAVATNQSGLARGLFDEEQLKKIHNKMLHKIEAAGGKISHIAYCPHHPDDQCECRKPKPGLLYQISAQLDNHRLEGCYFIGDSFKDIQAAKAVRCKPLLVLTGKGHKTLMDHEKELINVPIYENLFEAVDYILDDNDFF